MTDLPDTDALKGLLAQTTRGPWTAFDWEPPESDGQQVFRRPIGSMRDATTVAKVLGTTSGLLDGFAAPIRQADANARLISLAPPLAARVIEQDAEIERLRIALHEASDPDMIRAALGAVGTMDEPGDDNPWRQVASLRAVLWSIAHAAKIETKEDLMMAAANALPMQFRPRIARAALEDWQ